MYVLHLFYSALPVKARMWCFYCVSILQLALGEIFKSVHSFSFSTTADMVDVKLGGCVWCNPGKCSVEYKVIWMNSCREPDPNPAHSFDSMLYCESDNKAHYPHQAIFVTSEIHNSFKRNRDYAGNRKWSLLFRIKERISGSSFLQRKALQIAIHGILSNAPANFEVIWMITQNPDRHIECVVSVSCKPIFSS